SGVKTARYLAYNPPALSLWASANRVKNVAIALCRLRDSCVSVTDLFLLAKSLEQRFSASVVALLQFWLGRRTTVPDSINCFHRGDTPFFETRSPTADRL
ncbi:hypothetical protein TNCV_162771, partial [Trichonephila clavipes]